MDENKNLKYIIRPITLSDCNHVCDQLWTKLQFQGSKYENQVMMKIDSKGTLVAEDLETGQLIGICSGINLSSDLAFIGQYGVRPEYQGQGIGTALWDAAIQHIGPDRNVSLFTMDHMFDKYVKKSNFKFYPEKRGLRHMGKPDCSQLLQAIDGVSVVPISEDNIKKVIQYDKEVCDGFDRTVLIEELSKIEEYVNAVALNHKQEVLGYCIVKVSLCNTAMVEPLYANDERIAELLVAKCCRSTTIAQTDGLIYPTWSSNHSSIAIASKMGLKVARSTSILFTKRVIEGNMGRIFCISNRYFYPF